MAPGTHFLMCICFIADSYMQLDVILTLWLTVVHLVEGTPAVIALAKVATEN